MVGVPQGEVSDAAQGEVGDGVQVVVGVPQGEVSDAAQGEVGDGVQVVVGAWLVAVATVVEEEGVEAGSVEEESGVGEACQQVVVARVALAAVVGGLSLMLLS